VSRFVELPGFVDSHCHAFQRALRGSAAGGDFWEWREAMLGLAGDLDPGRVREGYAATYRELRAGGYTAVGEFHYVGRAEALAAVDAARDAGVELVLLACAYARGGLRRFRQESIGDFFRWLEDLGERGARVGVAPHSVRACPADWLSAIGAYAERERLVLHIHADEQPREIDECLAEHGRRPIELLADCGCLGPQTTVVHATHADDRELDLLAATGARVCLCPTTEASLGDGFAPVDRLCERGIPLCIGSDANVCTDALQELREVESIGRRQLLRRNVIPAERLLAAGSSEGAAALGLESWPSVRIDLEHPCLAGLDEADVPAALVAACSADVIA